MMAVPVQGKDSVTRVIVPVATRMKREMLAHYIM